MKHAPPPIRSWKFKGEKQSPLEIRLNMNYNYWREYYRMTQWPGAKTKMKRLKEWAAAYDIDLEDR